MNVDLPHQVRTKLYKFTSLFMAVAGLALIPLGRKMLGLAYLVMVAWSIVPYLVLAVKVVLVWLWQPFVALG